MNPQTPLYFDLIIIGAGPAGAAAAMTARKNALSVALIDKAEFPRDKLCGGLITGRARAAYQQIFDENINPDLFEARHRIGFFMNGEALGPQQEMPDAHLTMRYDMDHSLLAFARTAGAHAFTGQRIEALDLKARKIMLKSRQILGFTALIGADGVNSMVAKEVHGRAFNPAKIGFALEIEAPATAPVDENSALRIDFDAAAWGYGWHFPKHRGNMIGICGLQASNPDMKPRLAAYLQRLGTGEEVPVKGHFLPFGDFRQKPGRDNILLAGDAAGLVDPVTGEGIAYALQSGQMAAMAVYRAISGGNPGAACGHYVKALAPIHRSIRLARFIRPVIHARHLQPFFKKSFAGSRRLKQEYLRMLSGEIEYPRLIWLFAARLPRAIWRHFRAVE